MRAEPQPATYTPDPAITALLGWLGSGVDPASFPQASLRFRNQRWARAVGLDDLTDAQWTAHFARFEPLPGNLPRPQALAYHGHQFRVYNHQIGDGRGFLFAQLRDGAGRLLDLGTKGSGTTPYSRTADGRLTLKGGVREILATELLEALGVNTSRTFSLIETGEELWRGDEPSPTRSAVMVRLSHSHIRFGSFQRLALLEEADHMAQLIDYCLAQFPGPPPPADAPGRDEPAAILLHQVVERLADLAASYMVAGFVHGVLNTDNMNITGESFDYGPWRWLPRWDGAFTAAYFDEGGLYAFARQPEALHWNCGQLAVALRTVCDSDPLIAALDRFGPLYHQAMARRWCWRLGVEPRGLKSDVALIEASEAWMRETDTGPDAFFLRHRAGNRADTPVGTMLEDYRPAPGGEPIAPDEGETMLIDEVETLWSAIDRDDDWQPLHDKVARIRAYGAKLGEPPAPAGHGQGG